MSRLPTAAASRNMSACSAQAISQVGCRLMVASSANTSRPLASARFGDIDLALATKAATSSDAEGAASGNDEVEPAVRPSDISPAGFGLVGSPDIKTRMWLQAKCGLRSGMRQCRAAGPGIRPAEYRSVVIEVSSGRQAD